MLSHRIRLCEKSAPIWNNLSVAGMRRYVGLITLSVDWKRLSSKPAIVTLDDVRIVACPKSHFKVPYRFEEVNCGSYLPANVDAQW